MISVGLECEFLAQHREAAWLGAGFPRIILDSTPPQAPDAMFQCSVALHAAAQYHDHKPKHPGELSAPACPVLTLFAPPAFHFNPHGPLQGWPSNHCPRKTPFHTTPALTTLYQRRIRHFQLDLSQLPLADTHDVTDATRRSISPLACFEPTNVSAQI